MEILHSIKVPWRIALTVPESDLHVFETDNTTLRFQGELVDEKDSEHTVKIEFCGGHWIRVEPSLDDGHIVDESLYDWSNIPLRELLFENTSQWAIKFKEKWSKEKFCPDSMAYEITNSNWIDSLGTQASQLRHFLFCFEDMSLQILTRSLKWYVEEIGLSGHY
jgi:hypothetical protein